MYGRDLAVEPLPTLTRSDPSGHQSTHHILFLLSVLLLAVAPGCTLVRQPNPWPQLEQGIDRFEAPPELRPTTTTRFGSPCSSPGCDRPWIGRYFVSELPVAEACAVAHDAFRQTPGLMELHVEDDSPPDYAGCFAFHGKLNDFRASLLLFENTPNLRSFYPNLPAEPAYVIALHIFS